MSAAWRTFKRTKTLRGQAPSGSKWLHAEAAQEQEVGLTEPLLQGGKAFTGFAGLHLGPELIGNLQVRTGVPAATDLLTGYAGVFMQMHDLAFDASAFAALHAGHASPPLPML